MKVLIIGAGSIGVAIGATLGSEDHEVSFLASERTGREIREKGAHRTGIFGDRDLPPEKIRVYEEYAELPADEYDYVIVSVKTMANEEVAEKLWGRRDCIKAEGIIVVMQNGWGNNKPYEKWFPKEKVYMSRVITGFQRQAPNISKVTVHTAPLLIGSLHGCDKSAAASLAAAINEGGIECYESDDVEKALWAKMLYNCTLNPLGAIFGVPYGKLTESEGTVRIMNRLISETFSVMKAAGYSTFWESAEEYRAEFYRKLVPETAAHCSSTLQDIERKRKTEIETLTGKVIELGTAYGIATPTHQTIYDQIIFMEDQYLKKD